MAQNTTNEGGMQNSEFGVTQRLTAMNCDKSHELCFAHELANAMNCHFVT